MLVFQTFVYGLLIWLTLWAFGFKAFDAFLIPLAMTVVALAWNQYGGAVKELLGRE